MRGRRETERVENNQKERGRDGRNYEQRDPGTDKGVHGEEEVGTGTKTDRDSDRTRERFRDEDRDG